jgi:hypothetical protein
MAEKGAFVSFRCPDDLAAALGAYLAEHKVSRSAYIVSVLRDALGISAPASTEKEIYEQLQELRAATAELSDRFSTYEALEDRLRALEEYVGKWPGNASWVGDDGAQEQERRELELSQRQRDEWIRKRKAAKAAGMLTTREAFQLLARRVGWDPEDLQAMQRLPDDTEMNYRMFWQNDRPEHFRRFGFEPDFSLRDVSTPKSRWLAPDPAVYSSLLHPRAETE